MMDKDDSTKDIPLGHSTSDQQFSTSPYNELASRGIYPSLNTSSSTSTSTSTTTIANPGGPAMSILFDENAMLPTKRIDIRRYEPLPFKERYFSSGEKRKLASNSSLLRSLDDLHEPASSPQTEDLIKGMRRGEKESKGGRKLTATCRESVGCHFNTYGC
jgi:hypothetical protein